MPHRPAVVLNAPGGLKNKIVNQSAVGLHDPDQDGTKFDGMSREELEHRLTGAGSTCKCFCPTTHRVGRDGFNANRGPIKPCRKAHLGDYVDRLRHRPAIGWPTGRCGCASGQRGDDAGQQRCRRYHARNGSPGWSAMRSHKSIVDLACPLPLPCRRPSSSSDFGLGHEGADEFAGSRYRNVPKAEFQIDGDGQHRSGCRRSRTPRSLAGVGQEASVGFLATLSWLASWRISNPRRPGMPSADCALAAPDWTGSAPRSCC